MSQEHLQPKWMPVGRPKMRERAFAAQVDAGWASENA
jgi:hypothetical protein